LNREISAARELATTLDRNRENLQKEIAAITLENERLRKTLQRAETEREALFDDLHAEVSFKL
jgi:vacuolar-type H+-ATPase subunit D/Vma8